MLNYKSKGRSKKDNIPERTTRSLTLKPLDLNCDLSVVMLAKGAGSVKLSDAIDTLPSLLPNGTGQYGPLICK